jgi:hypothetical protein
MRIAMFTYSEEGQPRRARVQLNGTVAGYTVKGIERHQVTLSSGTGEHKVALYSGTKTNRGGTKLSPGKAQAKRPPIRRGPAAPENAAPAANLLDRPAESPREAAPQPKPVPQRKPQMQPTAQQPPQSKPVQQLKQKF